MDISRQEEIIAALWTIAAILALSNEYNVLGIGLSIKAIFDVIIAAHYGFKEARQELIEERAARVEEQ